MKTPNQDVQQKPQVQIEQAQTITPKKRTSAKWPFRLMRRKIKPEEFAGPQMPKALNDGDMRDLVMSLVQRSNINFGNVFLKPTDSELADRPELETWDGLIMRPEGYFRVAKEPQTGVKIILFEFEPKHLMGAKREDGSIGFSALDQSSTPDAPDVYRVGAYDPSTEQSVLDDAINDFCKDLRNNIVPELDLYLRDEAGYCATKETVESHTFRAANKNTAFGMYRDDDGEWQSIMYSTMRGTHDQSGQFERIAEKQRKGHFDARKMFSISTEEMKKSASFGGVLKHTLQYWGINSLKTFKGQQPLSEAMTFKMLMKRKGLRGKVDYSRVYARQQVRRSVRWTAGFVGSRYREYGMSAGVGLALSLKGLQFNAARMAFVAVGTAIGSTFIGKFIDEQTQKGVKTFFGSKSQYKQMKALLPQDRDYNRFFDAQTPENKMRPLKKVSPAFIDRLDLLGHLESGIMHSMDKTSAVSRRGWKEQYLGGLETRMFGKANIALCGNSVLKILPNGVVSLTHINDEFNVVSKYYAYNEAFVASKAAPLNDRIKDDLSKGVMKVTDDRGRAGLQTKKMRRSDFTKEIKKTYGGVTDIYGASTDVPSILAKIFNPNAKGNAHDRIAELLSEAARVRHMEQTDPLERLMGLSKDLREGMKAKKASAQAADVDTGAKATSKTALAMMHRRML